MTQSQQAIGIFDSGIGGFTVAHAIHRLLPQEAIYYFGDTAHLPYGDKSEKAIQSYALKIAGFLIEKKIKILVVACNTASAIAYPVLQEYFGKHIPIISMVEPTVTHLYQHEQYRKIGIIGTKGTIKSGVYSQRLKALKENIKVAEVATPLLAPMVEEGFFNNNISQTIIHSYLNHYKLKHIQALVLACTHYPLIKKEIRTYYQHRIDIIDPSEVVAAEVKKVLTEQSILNIGTPIENEFMVSNWTPSFEKSSKIFWGKQVSLTEHNIWND